MVRLSVPRLRPGSLPWRWPWLPARGVRGRPVVALSLAADAMLVRLAPGDGSGPARVLAAERGDPQAATLRRWRGQGLVGGAQRLVVVLPTRLRATTVLPRPDVPDAELAEAVRWQLAASLDYPADQALVDLLPLPQLSPGQPRQVMAVSARVDAVQEHLAPLLAAGLRPDVIDIEDTAQRNLALRLGGPDGAVATLGFGDREALLTLVADGELVVTRAIALPDLAAQAAGAIERLTLQVQRTLDAFERQATRFAVRTLQLLPGPLDPTLATELAPLLSQRVQPVMPSSLLDLDHDSPAVPAHRLLMLAGAALGARAASAGEPASPPVAAAPGPARPSDPPATTPAELAQAVLAAAAQPPSTGALSLVPVALEGPTK